MVVPAADVGTSEWLFTFFLAEGSADENSNGNAVRLLSVKRLSFLDCT